MPSVQFTVRGMMVTVAVIAFDCFVLIMTDGNGVLLIGLLLNVGFIRWWRTQGRRRRFWGGFVVAGMGAVLAYIGYIQTLLPAFFELLSFSYSRTLPYLPNKAAEWVDVVLDAPNNLIFMIPIIEVAFGLPMLLLALIGGLLSAFTRRQRVPHSDAVLSASAEA
jgi:hypothetical protein